MDEAKHRFCVYILVCLAFTWLYAKPGFSKSEQVRVNPAIKVTITQLTANPTHFDKKLVKVVGQLTAEIQSNSSHRNLVLTCPASLARNSVSLDSEGVMQLSLSPQLKLKKAIAVNELVEIEGVFQQARTSRYAGSVTVTKLDSIQSPKPKISPLKGYGGGPSAVGSTDGDHGPALPFRRGQKK